MFTLKNLMKTTKNWRKSLPLAILVAVTLFYAIMLMPELTVLSPELNDNVFHYALTLSMQREFAAGGNILDHWVPYWSMGYPVFHHYQHIPHLIIVAIYNIFYGQIPLFLIFRFFTYILLVLYPLVLYFSLRRMRFSALIAAFAALFALTLSNISGYGLELGSFLWRGSGMFSQLWATFLFPLTVSSIYISLKENRSYFQSVIFLFLLANSQVMYGLMAIITSALFLFIDFDFAQIFKRVKRFSFILIMFFLMIAYLLIPLIIDSPYHAHSTYDFLEKWDSYGWKTVVTQFLNGDIFDSGRLPIITFLVVIGAIFALSRKSFRYHWAAAGFILWFLLYFGRSTWGILIDLLPLSSALHLHRFITMVHFFGAILAGIGLSAVFSVLKRRIRLVFVIILIALLVSPIISNRFHYIRQNNEWLRDNKVRYQKEEKDFTVMLNTIKHSPPGRVYPGRRANWGKDFKVGRASVFYLLPVNEIVALSNLPFSWALTGDFSVNFNEWDLAHYNLFNVRYILADDKKKVPSFAKLIKSRGRFRLYKIETSGYFDLVKSPLAIYADKNSIWNLMVLWMRSPWVAKNQFISVFFDRRSHSGYQNSLLLENRNYYWPVMPNMENGGRIKTPKQKKSNVFSVSSILDIPIYKKAVPGKMLSETVGKNKFESKIRVNEECFLLFKMTYHPGWDVYVDGKKTKTVIMSPGFIGVKVTKGEHAVKFLYRPPRWKGFLVIISFITAGWLFFRERKRWIKEKY
jgi:Bacterial membrane protein YfhO/6-pyruvoyl-tetrahydropterin synthase related domain